MFSLSSETVMEKNTFCVWASPAPPPVHLYPVQASYFINICTCWVLSLYFHSLVNMHFNILFFLQFFFCFPHFLGIISSLVYVSFCVYLFQNVSFLYNYYSPSFIFSSENDVKYKRDLPSVSLKLLFCDDRR